MKPTDKVPSQYLTNCLLIGGRRFWPTSHPPSSPLKTAKPNSATELEDISREISAAIDQPRQLTSASNDEENNNGAIFTELFGMKQEKVIFVA